MALTKKVKATKKYPMSSKHIEAFLKRIEKFDNIKPKETIWSEKRMMDGVRSYVQNEKNA